MGAYEDLRNKVQSQWFSFKPTLWSISPSPDHLNRECWLYEDDYKITFGMSFLSFIDDDDKIPVCGHRLTDSMITCVLPPDHECKHFGVTDGAALQGLKVTSIKIERLNENVK